MEEIWKDIKGYEGLYQVSNLGRVKSLDRYVNHESGYKALKKGKILKVHNYINGYQSIALSKENKIKRVLLHRLVYETFNGEIPDGMQVNHINEDKTDNRLENLNLMDCKTNINWGTGIERRKEKRSITVLQYDLDNNFIKEWPSGREIHRQLQYSQGNINMCCLNKRKTAYGYLWKYKQ